MSPLPQSIRLFIQQNKVINIACHDTNRVWAASCFYALRADAAELIVCSQRTTQHGTMMLAQPHIAGTISIQPNTIADIQGIQLTARAELLNNSDSRYAIARTDYIRLYPTAARMLSDIWLLHLDSIKYTDNRLIFAHKTYWNRHAA